MTVHFSEKELELLDDIGFNFDVRGDLTPEQVQWICQKVPEHYAYNGMDQSGEHWKNLPENPPETELTQRPPGRGRPFFYRKRAGVDSAGPMGGRGRNQ